jgi:hypothetical protein
VASCELNCFWPLFVFFEILERPIMMLRHIILRMELENWKGPFF